MDYKNIHSGRKAEPYVSPVMFSLNPSLDLEKIWHALFSMSEYYNSGWYNLFNRDNNQKTVAEEVLRSLTVTKVKILSYK